MKNLLIVTNVAFGCVSETSPYYCDNADKITRSIINISSYFEYIIFINDEHEPNDAEFKRLPPHLIKNTMYGSRLSHIENQLKSKYFFFLRKNLMSALRSTHNRDTICRLECDNIFLAGFAASIDVLSTAIDLCQLNKEFFIIDDLVDDMNKEQLKNSLSIMNWMGIKRIKSNEICKL